VPRRPAAPPAPGSAYASALRRLARRDHGKEELRRALAGRGHAEPEIAEALARLKERGLLDDAGFAARYARSRLAHQALGRHRIRRELRLRGVGRAEAEAGLGTALAEVPETGAVDAAARRYWKLKAHVEPERRLKGLWAFLLRRGFGAGLVNERLRALWPKWSDALDGLEPADEGGDEGL
jgi:regulatory protein